MFRPRIHVLTCLAFATLLLTQNASAGVITLDFDTTDITDTDGFILLDDQGQLDGKQLTSISLNTFFKHTAGSASNTYRDDLGILLYSEIAGKEGAAFYITNNSLLGTGTSNSATIDVVQPGGAFAGARPNKLSDMVTKSWAASFDKAEGVWDEGAITFDLRALLGTDYDAGDLKIYYVYAFTSATTYSASWGPNGVLGDTNYSPGTLSFGTASISTGTGVVPEPSTALIFALGIVGSLGSRRRRRRRR